MAKTGRTRHGRRRGAGPATKDGAGRKAVKKGDARAGARPAKRAGRSGASGSGRKVTSKSALGKGGGDVCAARLELLERAGSVSDKDANLYEYRARGGKSVARRGKRIPQVTERTCGALAAAGHLQRAALLRKLLEGPATYRALQKVTKLKAGPLYHHINQLRLAGLILPKQRDLYELTRGGRNLILAITVIGPMIRDGRRRPIAAGG